MLHRVALLVFLLACSIYGMAQGSECPAPPSDVRSTRPNIFNDTQEMALGDAMAEQIERDIHVLHGPLNEYLQKIGDRLLRMMPPTQLKFKFQLVNIPAMNAFTIAGGHIYVTRRLVASARSEDELAGVLAHEIGHALSRDPSVDMTYLFQNVLGVNSLGDRKDVYEKFNLLQENIRTKSKALAKIDRSHKEEQQLAADNVAIIAIAKAGYNTNAFAEFWDRFAETKGKTGNAFTDFFGATSPESKRLRESQKLAQSIPPDCHGHEPVDDTAFKNWQADVVENNSANRTEILPGLLNKAALSSPLRNEMHRFRFSPDGRYILAQDGASVFVLSHHPLKVLFRINAKDMADAQFSPDSDFVVLHNNSLRVERWEVATRKRVFVNELPRRAQFANIALSPDGRILACYANDGSLEFLDSQSGASLWKQSDFYEDPEIRYLNSFFAQLGLPALFHNSVPLVFSPDGRYVVASRPDNPFVLEVSGWKKISMPGAAKDLLKNKFSFQTSDTVLSMKAGGKENAVLAHFPSGEVVKRFTVPVGSIYAVSHGPYGIMSPANPYSAAIVDIMNDKTPIGLKTPAVDIYDDEFLSEKKNGEIGIYKLDPDKTNAALEVADISQSPLPHPKAFSVSADLRYMALSAGKRTAVWDLQKNEQIRLLRGSQEAYFSSDGYLMLDFPKYDETKRSLLALRLSDGAISNPVEVPDPRTRIVGKYGLIFKSNNSKDNDFSRNMTVTVMDMYKNTQVWSKTFPKERPEITVDPLNNTMVLAWGFDTGAAKDDVKNDPRFSGTKDEHLEMAENDLLHVLDIEKGALLGKIIVQTGKRSFKIDQVTAGNDRVMVGDNSNRIMIYRLSTGDLMGRVFGDHPVMAAKAGIFSVWSDSDAITIYDLNTLDVVNQFSFKTNISAARFDQDGSRMLVLTDDQTVYIIDPKGTMNNSGTQESAKQ